MKNPIRKLEIKNFKTAKNLSLDCKRINLIIGKPNVGKSNILEAISLLGAHYIIGGQKLMSEFIRYERFEDLFYDKQTANAIEVNTDIGYCTITHEYRYNHFHFYLAPSKLLAKEIISSNDAKGPIKAAEEFQNKNGHAKSYVAPYHIVVDEQGKHGGESRYTTWDSPVKKYEFHKGSHIGNRFHSFLVPPYGNNLYAVVNTNKKLFKEVASFFKEYKLRFLLKSNEPKFEVMKEIKGIVYSYDYNLIADTLQRYIFNLMAIESNKESILLFEEPEAHMFPPYVKNFAQKIIASDTNQFFIATHSPFILNTIFENADIGEVAIFAAIYENFQTKIKPLSRPELEDMINYGNDIFFSEKLNG